MTVYCECCDLPESSCGKAAEQRQRTELARWRRTLLERGWTLAIYPGYCVRCGVGFKPGVAIRATGPAWQDAPAAWIAECCEEGNR